MKKKKSLEQKIYEKLGVRSFKKLVIGAISLPIKIFCKILRRDYNEIDKTDGSNYFLNTRKYGKDAPEKFMKMLWFNGIIHTLGLLFNIYYLIKSPDLVYKIFYSILILLNSYCVMLQRYNGIRISNYNKRRKELDKRQEEQENNNINSYTLVKTKELDYHIKIQSSSLKEDIKELKELRITVLSLNNHEELNINNGGHTKTLTINK